MRFSQYFKPGDILTLDAGCGNGAFCFEAYELGNRVIGIDFDKEKIKKCNEFRDYLGLDAKLCQFILYNIYDLLSLHQQFDQIICFETLESMKDDERAIKNFSALMKPGGLLHICTPYRKRKRYYGEVVSDKEDGGHVRMGYTFEDFEDLLGKNGFKIIDQDTAVGFFGKKLISFMNWLPDFLPLKAFFFLLLYPLTWLDPASPNQPLNIYVRAQKL